MSVASGCRRRHHGKRLAGPAHRVCHGRPDLRLLPPAAGEDRRCPHLFRRGRPRQGAQSPPDGGRADMGRVVVTSDAYFARTGNPLCIPDTSAITWGRPRRRLVIIDPLQGFLPAGGGDGQPQPDRSALLPLRPSAPGTAARPSSRCTPTSAPTSGRARLADAPTSGTSPAASS